MANSKMLLRTRAIRREQPVEAPLRRRFEAPASLQIQVFEAILGGPVQHPASIIYRELGLPVVSPQASARGDLAIRTGVPRDTDTASWRANGTRWMMNHDEGRRPDLRTSCRLS